MVALLAFIMATLAEKQKLLYIQNYNQDYNYAQSHVFIADYFIAELFKNNFRRNGCLVRV